MRAIHTFSRFRCWITLLRCAGVVRVRPSLDVQVLPLKDRRTFSRQVVVNQGAAKLRRVDLVSYQTEDITAFVVVPKQVLNGMCRLICQVSSIFSREGIDPIAIQVPERHDENLGVEASFYPFCRLKRHSAPPKGVRPGNVCRASGNERVSHYDFLVSQD